MTPFIVTLTGPSCAGKTTLERQLKGVGFVQVISHTTREPRAGEEDGKAYYFIDKSEFKRLAAVGFFMETVYFNGNYYGVSATEIKRVADQGKPIVVIVEPQGLKQIKAYCNLHSWNLCSVFIDNPGEVIGKRFLDRMLADYQAAGPGTAQKILDTYSTRLGIMLKDECWWGEDIGPMCDMWLLSFDERNIEDVVGEIGRRAVDALSDTTTA